MTTRDGLLQEAFDALESMPLCAMGHAVETRRKLRTALAAATPEPPIETDAAARSNWEHFLAWLDLPVTASVGEVEAAALELGRHQGQAPCAEVVHRNTRVEHDRQSSAGAHLFDEACPLCRASSVAPDEDWADEHWPLRATPEPPDLSATWRAVEEALPEGWKGPSVAQNWRGRWYAYVYLHSEDAPADPTIKDSVNAEDHDTPAAALNALASRLLAQQPETGEPR